MNLKKVQRQIKRTIESSDFSTKILLYFSTKQVGEDYDSYEKNYSFTNLNPVTIKGYVSDISSEALIWSRYGLSEVGAKEILCDKKYASWFRICNKITIDGDDFQVYKENVGHRFLISELPLKIIKVIVTRIK